MKPLSVNWLRDKAPYISIRGMGDKQRTTSRIFLIEVPVSERKRCDVCGVTYTKDNKWNHNRTKKHQQALESQSERKADELALKTCCLKDSIRIFSLPLAELPVSDQLDKPCLKDYIRIFSPPSV